jgi:hypothetical protein
MTLCTIYTEGKGHMAMKPSAIVDAPIANKVDADAIRERLKDNHVVQQLVKDGALLLAKTNQPNRITLAQFTPFIPIFNVDKTRYAEDIAYKKQMDQLGARYVRDLEINLYEPTIVIQSKEEPIELVVLNRLFTRISTDNVEGESKRETVPAAVSKISGTTRDDQMLAASIADLGTANRSPKQMEFFKRVRENTAIINKAFVERNASPIGREAIIGKEALAAASGSGEAAAVPHAGPVDTFMDDDD